MPGQKQPRQGAPDAELGQSTEQSPLLQNLDGGATPKESPRVLLFADSVGTMSGASFVINMFVDICPLGFVPLSSGLKKTGYVPALVLLLVVCSMCTYTMGIVGQTAAITGKNTFRSQWEATLGKKTSFVPVLVIVLATLGSCVAYSRFCADLFADALPCFGVTLSRDACLCMFTFLVLMPLCMLKGLSSLSWSSGGGVILLGYAAFIMILRAVDGTYAPGGKYFEYLPKHPTTYIPKHHLFEYGFESINLVNYLVMAFLAHCNGCKYYRELNDSTPRRMKMHTGIAMSMAALYYVVTMMAGFHTFGMASHDTILQNYAKQDVLANVAQLGVASAILASFPIMFCSLRESLLEVFCIMWPNFTKLCIKDTRFSGQHVLSVVVLWLLTLTAHIFTEAGMVVSVVGAICGSASIFIVPCVLYEAALVKFCNKDEHYHDSVIARSLALVGALLAVLGCVSVLVHIEEAS